MPAIKTFDGKLVNTDLIIMREIQSTAYDGDEKHVVACTAESYVVIFKGTQQECEQKLSSIMSIINLHISEHLESIARYMCDHLEDKIKHRYSNN